MSSLPIQHGRQKEQQKSLKVKLKRPSFEIKSTMDLCNLYVKGIKPGLTSTELFNLFEPYGRIISAKVMEANTGGAQTGFGFVSFSSSTEAAKALVEINSKEPQDDDEKSFPVMVVRFHEPKVPRLEHNFNHQLSLLSYSSLCSHFFTRKIQKIIPLKPIKEESLVSNNMNHYSPVLSSSIPPLSHYSGAFGNMSHDSHHPYYYYPSYWTHQGVVYTNFINPAHSYPIPPQNQNSNNTTKTHQRHSWNGTPKKATDTITTKLLQVLENEYNITDQNNPGLINKIIQLDRTEQSNCLNNSIYFKKKISHLKSSIT